MQDLEFKTWAVYDLNSSLCGHLPWGGVFEGRVRLDNAYIIARSSLANATSPWGLVH